jgi:hypothetical protein
MMWDGAGVSPRIISRGSFVLFHPLAPPHGRIAYQRKAAGHIPQKAYFFGLFTRRGGRGILESSAHREAYRKFLWATTPFGLASG